MSSTSVSVCCAVACSMRAAANHSSATADLQNCADLAERHGLRLIYSFAVHNLGFAASLRGDLSAALALLDTAAEAKSQLGRPDDAVSWLDRAAVLLAAGLGDEAGRGPAGLPAVGEGWVRVGLGGGTAVAGQRRAAQRQRRAGGADRAQAGRDFARQRRTAWATLARRTSR